VLVCVAIAIWGLMVFLSDGRVGPLIDELKAKGEPVSISEIIPPKIPDNENAAVLYARAFELLPKGEANSEFGRLDQFVSRKDQRKNPDEWTSARRVLAKYAKALALAEAAAARPKCRFPVDWARGWEAEMSHLKGLRKLSVLAAARALVDAKAGRTRQALDSVGLGIRIGESLRKEPTLAPYFARIAHVKRSVRSLENVLSHCPITRNEALQLDSALSEVDLVSAGVDALRGERACGIDSFERLVGRVVEGRGRGPDGFKHPPTKRGTPAFGSGVLRTLFERDEARYIRMMTSFIDRAGLPYRVIARTEKPAHPRDRDVPRLPSISGMLLPHMGWFARSRDEGIAAISAGRLMLALAAYRGRSGSYPERLADLRGKLTRKLPEDPFAGTDFIYKREGSGFLLYSIGPNLKDDGGVEIKPAKSKASEIPGGDIVWRTDL